MGAFSKGGLAGGWGWKPQRAQFTLPILHPSNSPTYSLPYLNTHSSLSNTQLPLARVGNQLAGGGWILGARPRQRPVNGGGTRRGGGGPGAAAGGRHPRRVGGPRLF